MNNLRWLFYFVDNAYETPVNWANLISIPWLEAGEY